MLMLILLIVYFVLLRCVCFKNFEIKRKDRTIRTCVNICTILCFSVLSVVVNGVKRMNLVMMIVLRMN